MRVLENNAWNILHLARVYAQKSVLSNILCSSLGFFELLSRKTVCFLELILSAGKHPSVFSRLIVWQAKHDKSGLSWKLPIESQWSMCEIEKSLCEIGKSLREIRKSLYDKLKLPYENEKNVTRDHNYHSRMKNCHVRFVLTVGNEKSLGEKKKSPFDWDYRLVLFWAGET